LLRADGPFIAIPVLTEAFPQGLDTVPADILDKLRRRFRLTTNRSRSMRRWIVADRGVVDHGRAGSRDPAVLHPACEPAGVRVIADHQCPLRHAGFVSEPDLSPEGDRAPSMDGRLCRSRRIIAKHGFLRHRGRRLGNRDPQEDCGRVVS